MQIPLFRPPVPQWIQEANYNVCITPESISDALNDLLTGDFIALDIETSGLKSFSDDLVGISMSHKVGTSYYFPVAHKRGTNIDPEDVHNLLVPFIDGRYFIYHRAQFDISFLQKYGMNAKVLSDTLFLARSYDFRRNNRLKPLAESMLGLDVIELMDLSEGDGFNYAYFTPSYSYLYACQDADLTLRLYLQMKDQEKVIPYIHRLEMDIIPTIARMERTGFPVDIEKAKIHHENTKVRLLDVTESIYSYAGMSFNIGSSDQLAFVLFERLGLRSTRTTDGDKVSTGVKALEDIQNDHPIIPLILEWRELQKMDSSFYSPYFERIKDQGVSRIFTNINPCGARTGRFTSSNVNIQQVSPAIKEIFIPEDGYYLVEADYSQIEYRIFASMCRDPFMMNAFWSGQDMHTATADRLRSHFGLSEDDVITKEIRKKAKTLNFSVLFGSGERNVASQLQCSVEEARKLIDEYYRQFPTVSDWKDEMIRKAVKNGYCETKFGRRRYIPELDYFNEELYSYSKPGMKLPRGMDQSDKNKFYKLLHGLRIAVNTPIQGTAADVYKVALRRVEKHVLSTMDVKFHAPVHDSYVMSVHESIDPEEFSSHMKGVTEIVIPEFVPIVMDVEFGYNWKNTTKLFDDEGNRLFEVGRK